MFRENSRENEIVIIQISENFAFLLVQKVNLVNLLFKLRKSQIFRIFPLNPQQNTIKQTARVINQEARTEIEARLGEEMRRSLREQQAEWERVLRTNREQADQEQKTLANR
jgi:hypothetical protein